MVAFPMHGQEKLSNEGYRTRDGHFIEWFSKMFSNRGAVAVASRPDPYLLYVKSAKARSRAIHNTLDLSSATLRIPSFRNRRLWWLTSASSYPKAIFSGEHPFVLWNPFVAMNSQFARGNRKIHFDLLDDWTTHFAFAQMRPEVEAAYESAFASATSVTANSEATLTLAHKYGRTDARLLTNGCDPERFMTDGRSTGPMTVGYVGKIGRRLDLDLILTASKALPDVQFIFAGPFLDREYYQPMKDASNITLLGDVHYNDVPDLLTRFDIGWVPHLTGAGEVGGDVIKTYEYRAAGLPVLTTPVLGAGDRGLSEVHVQDPENHIKSLKEFQITGPRVARVHESIPPEHTWENKAKTISDLILPVA
ncbi:glycosyltransferase [Kocuria rosea]|nr:glycosyltransferase [Kocuria rosea]